MTETAETPLVEQPPVKSEDTQPEDAPAVVDLTEVDSLRLENMNLKVMGASQAAEHAKLQMELAAHAMEAARATYADNLRHQVLLAREITAHYGVEATRYDHDTRKQQLVLRGPRPVPQAPPDAE